MADRNDLGLGNGRVRARIYYLCSNYGPAIQAYISHTIGLTIVTDGAIEARLAEKRAHISTRWTEGPYSHDHGACARPAS